METFSALLAICAGNSPVPGQWRGALMFALICTRINGWVNNRDAGDLRRHRTHYDVIVMYYKIFPPSLNQNTKQRPFEIVWMIIGVHHFIKHIVILMISDNVMCYNTDRLCYHLFPEVLWLSRLSLYCNDRILSPYWLLGVAKLYKS